MMPMVTKLVLASPPTKLQAVSRQFEAWRRVRRPGTPIPPALWNAAIAVARRHGVTRTALALHLDSHKLKTLADAPSHGAEGPGGGAPTFVEMPPIPFAPAGPECTIELEGPRGGRLRVALRGGIPPDLVALTRVVWGRGR
jgi:hypothetical protein